MIRKKVKTFFKNNPAAKVKSKGLSKKLGVQNPNEYAQLKEILHKLTNDGFLVRQGKRYTYNNVTSGKLIGELQIVENGNYGFVIIENNKLGDIFIAERNLGTAFHGDIVEVSLFAKQKGRKNVEGQIISVVQRTREEIVGSLKRTKSFYFVDPDESKVHRDIYVPDEFLNKAVEGDKVVVNEIEWKSHLLNPEGKIKEVLGKAGAYDTEIASLAREFNLDYNFPNKVLKAAEKISKQIPNEEINKRLDLREETIFTIDPDDAKDFDDAVSVKKLENGNFEVGVHIADVSHYVTKGNPIYEEAYKRGTSVYFVGKVIPMLPENLSNNICSLVPNQDRLTYSIIFELTPRGSVSNYKILKSVINSKRRFTYNEVQDILDNGSGELFDEIFTLNKLAKSLKRKRIRNGSVNFTTPEIEFKLNKKGIPEEINIKEIKDSHQLIEEFMLAANQIAAKHVNKQNKNGIPFVYRIHDFPDKEKLDEFSNFVRSLGYSFTTESAANPKQLQKLLEKVEGTEEEALINEVAIRSMAKAVYSPENIGHYGLAFNYYTHFTSPIRRFPDLIVHQILYEYIEHGKKIKYNLDELNSICDRSSMQERNAVNAERLSVKLKKIEYLKNCIGEEFLGVISGVKNFGMFIQLNKNLAEGLIPLRSLKDDFYYLDEKNYALIGSSTGKRYRLGDKVKVKVIRVDESRREIDFSLIE